MGVNLPIPKINSPFRFWCQKALPLVYDDSLSYYEVLCKVVKYINGLRDDVVLLGEDVSKLNELFNELEKFVKTYFDNLDVQNEVNIKLDKMAESGYFDNIIQNYLNLKAVIIRHKNVEDMKNDMSIKKGYIITTAGYYTETDNGGCNWSITDNIISDNDGIKLSNGLYAKRILETTMNVECFGAYGNNINDDSSAICNALSKGIKINFSGKKTYKISEVFDVNSDYTIMIEGNNTTLNIDDTNYINNTTNGFTIISLNNDTIINNLNIDYLCRAKTNSICPLRVRKGEYHYWDNVNIHTYENGEQTHGNCCWFYFNDYYNNAKRKFGTEKIVLKHCSFINETTAHKSGVGALWITGASKRIWSNSIMQGDGIGKIYLDSCNFYTATLGDTVNIWLSSIDSGGSIYKNTAPSIDNITFSNCKFKGKNYYTENTGRTSGSGMCEFGNGGISNGTITGLNCCNYKNINFNNCIFTVSDKWQQHLIGTSCAETSFNFNNCIFNNEYSDDTKTYNISLFNNGSQKIGDNEIIADKCTLNFNSCNFDSKKALNNSRSMPKTANCKFNYTNCTIKASAFYPETDTKIYSSNIIVFGSGGIRNRHAIKDSNNPLGYTLNDFANTLEIYNTFIDGDVYLWHNDTINNSTITKALFIYANSASDTPTKFNINNNFIHNKISWHSYDYILTTIGNDNEDVDINVYDTKGVELICTNNTTGFLTFDTYDYGDSYFYKVIHNNKLYPKYIINNNNRFYDPTKDGLEIINYTDSEPISVKQRSYPISPQILNSNDTEKRSLNIEVKNIMFGGFYDRYLKGLRFMDYTDSNFASLYTAKDTNKNTEIKKTGFTLDVKNISVELASPETITEFFSNADNLSKLTKNTDPKSEFYNHYYFTISFKTYPMDSATPRMDYKIDVYCTNAG